MIISSGNSSEEKQLCSVNPNIDFDCVYDITTTQKPSSAPPIQISPPTQT